MDHLNANMEGEIVEGEIVEGGIAEAMEGEIAEAMEGEIAEAEGEAVEAVGDAIGEAEEERRRLEREAHNEAARAGHAGGIQGVPFEQRIRLLRADLLVQCGRNRLPCGARAYKTVYFEESLMVALKKKGRGGRGSVEGDPIEEPGSGQRAHGGFHLHAAEMVERRGQSRAAQPLHVRPGELPPHTYRGPTRFRIFEELRGRAERHTGKDAPRPNCGEGAVPEAPLVAASRIG